MQALFEAKQQHASNKHVQQGHVAPEVLVATLSSAAEGPAVLAARAAALAAACLASLAACCASSCAMAEVLSHIAVADSQGCMPVSSHKAGLYQHPERLRWSGSDIVSAQIS